ncbi:MAG: polyphosphate polymerase domain-containing protein [Anaerohalosphaeraceae bacterium]
MVEPVKRSPGKDTVPLEPAELSGPSPIQAELAGPSREEIAPVCSLGRKDLTCCRYELKYRITEGKAQAIRDFVQHYLSVDKYALMYPDRQYPISSLYWDSPDLQLCRETLSGKSNRFKLRIRTYNDLPQTPLFLEVKRRVNKVIVKSRARVERSELQAALEGTLDLHGRSEKDRQALKQFLFYKQALQAQPVVLVRYMREAYEGEGDHRVRVTFDRQLHFRKPHGLEVTLNGPGWQTVPVPFVVLEIKFTDHYPAWLETMIRLFELNLSSMSKYVSSVSCFSEGVLFRYLE